MKKITRIISALFILFFLVSMLPLGVFAASFTDVKGNEYYARSASALADKGILSGYTDGTFGADKYITRAEMATMICRMLGQKSIAKTTTSFSDVKREHWASGFVKYAADNGIINGDGDGKFRPEDYVKYEEAIKLAVCAIDYDRCLMPSALDWSAPYIEIAKANGITNNLKGRKGSYVTRGDVAVMVYNALNVQSSTTLSVPSIIQASTSIADAQFIKHTGSLTYTGQVNQYTFTPTVSGRYRFDLGGMKAGATASLTILDHLGEKLWDGKNLHNGGATLEYLTKDSTYTIQVGQYTDTCNYTLTIGCQKPAVNATNYNVIHDSIEFTHQANAYGFIAPRIGTYSFSLSGMQADARVSLIVLNDLGEKIWSGNSLRNATATVEGLKEGKVYTIRVEQYTDFSDYTLHIGLQKTPFYASDLTKINDSIEYQGQVNTYAIVASRNGSHTFTLSGIHADARVHLIVYDSLGEKLWDSTNVRNVSATVNNLKAGSTYVIQVIYYTDTCNYSLTIN